MKKAIIALMLISSAVHAQPQQQSSPAEFSLQAVQMVTQLGQVAQAQQKRIEALESQVNALRQQLDEAKKDKPDAKQ